MSYLQEVQEKIDSLLEERDALTLELREQGMTLRELAIDLGVTASRVHQRLAKMNLGHPLDELRSSSRLKGMA